MNEQMVLDNGYTSYTVPTSAGMLLWTDTPAHEQVIYSVSTEDIYRNIDEADHLFLKQLIEDMNDHPFRFRYINGDFHMTPPINKKSFLDEIKRILEYE